MIYVCFFVFFVCTFYLDTAQVTPLEVTSKLVAAALAMVPSCEVVQGRANRVAMDEKGKVIGVDVEGIGLIDAENVIICLG
jgi:hypothetical protein